MDDTSGSSNNQEQNIIQPSDRDVAALSSILVESRSWNNLRVKVAIVLLESLMYQVLSPDVISMSVHRVVGRLDELGIPFDEGTEALNWLLEEFQKRRSSNPLSGLF